MKIINNRFEITNCTAIAHSIGSTARQSAVFFHDLQDDNRDGDSVIFGYTESDFSEDFDFSKIDSSAFSSWYEDLDSVEF